MQTAIASHSGCCSTQLASRKCSSRLSSRTPAFSSSTSRARSVQVYAKGKGKRRGMMTSPTGPGVPQMQAPPVPEVDPENEEFVVFMRSKSGSSARNWVPLSVVKGGQSANLLVKALESEWGKRLYSQTLIRNIAQAVYKDKDSIIKSVRQNYPPFKDVPGKDFEFAFKIRDKSVPKDWLKADGVTPFPPESELTDTPIDRFRKFFDPSNLATMFGGDSSSTPAAQ